MEDLPTCSNFFGALRTALTRQEVAGLYGAAGWEVRKPDDWEHYEVRRSWAELVIESESPILMHGPVADLGARADKLVAPLRAAGVAFTAECYGPDPERELLLELQS